LKKTIKKIFLSNPEIDEVPAQDVVRKRIENIQSIWHNKHHNDVGIEKVVRLFLAASQFLFPGLYIKHFTGKFGISYEEIATDIFVLLKVIFPVVVLKFGLQHIFILKFLVVWFLIETMLYLTTLVFASDIFTRPRSYRRSMLLMFLNYLQIVFSFGILYSLGNHLNKAFESWYDPIYFSLITSTTVGYGDYYPISGYGKLLASTQIIIFFVVVVMFLNFFSTNIEQKGYFDHDSENNKKQL